MSLKLKLSAAAFIAFAAISATATSASAANPNPTLICDQATSKQSCGSHLIYVQQLRNRHEHDTTPIYMRYSDPRTNSALNDAGGGGGGGGGGR
jgi:hypothetical protein